MSSACNMVKYYEKEIPHERKLLQTLQDGYNNCVSKNGLHCHLLKEDIDNSEKEITRMEDRLANSKLKCEAMNL